MNEPDTNNDKPEPEIQDSDITVMEPQTEKKIAPVPNRRALELIGSLGSWIVPFLVYLSTIAPCVTPGDAGEFITSTYRFSLAHPPGYPLYMLLMKLWSALPFSLGFDPLAVKCSLFSAVVMVIMCGFFYRLARTLTGSAVASIAATLVLAFSRTLWKFAVVTEVYALHLLLIVLVLVGLAMAREGKKSIGLVIAAFAFGLGLAHHHTIVFLLPLVIFLWPRGKFEKGIPVAGIIAGFILPLLLYLFLPLFAANTPGYSEAGFTAGDFVDIVTRAEYRERAEFQDLPQDQLVGGADIFSRAMKYLPKQFGWIVLILSIAGWFFAPAGKRIWALWSAITAVLWILAISFLSRGSPLGMPFSFLRSVDEFLLPVNIFVALGFAWLLAPLAKSLESQKDMFDSEGQNFIPPGFIPLFIMLLFCVVPFLMARTNAHYSDMTHHTFAQDQTRNILEQVPDDGVLIVSGDESFMFEYLQEVREIKQDVKLLVYPFRYPDGDSYHTPVDSLAIFLKGDLGDRDCVFTFEDASMALDRLDDPKALRLDGVAYTLVDRDEGMPVSIPGNANIWTGYQLRNLDKETLNGLVFDDFEYETIDRYVNGLRASVSWLDASGYAADPTRSALVEMSDSLEEFLKKTDYPGPPSREDD